MATTRLPAHERNHYENRQGKVTEPALGTLTERLDVLTRRFGGNVGTPRASNVERREYVAWLAKNDPTATNPYA